MERKINPCLCGGDVEITKRTHTSGMDGCYEDWEFNCKKCGGYWTWAADNFYGRKSYTKDEVIDIWNKIHADKESKNTTNGDVLENGVLNGTPLPQEKGEVEEDEEQEPVLDKVRAEIENHCGLAKENHCKYCSYCNSVMGVREILEIIDKHTEENEDI